MQPKACTTTHCSLASSLSTYYVWYQCNVSVTSVSYTRLPFEVRHSNVGWRKVKPNDVLCSWKNERPTSSWKIEVYAAQKTKGIATSQRNEIDTTRIYIRIYSVFLCEIERHPSWDIEDFVETHLPLKGLRVILRSRVLRVAYYAELNIVLILESRYFLTIGYYYVHHQMTT